MVETMWSMWFFLHYFVSLLSTCGPKYPEDDVLATEKMLRSMGIPCMDWDLGGEKRDPLQNLHISFFI